MIIRIKSIYSKLIYFCLVVLGFSSCIKDDPVDEYGVPSAKFKVKGKVVSKEDQNTAIKDIRIVMIDDVDESKIDYRLDGDTAYTNSNGLFEINTENFPLKKFKVKIQDIDGDKNGSFEDEERTIEFNDSDFQGGSGGWYKGEATKDMGTIKLSPKQKDN